jgi:citryl-CoA lyase
MADKWKTSISSDGEDGVVRDVPREEVAEMPFSDAIFLILSGERPSEEESEIFKSMLSISIDHGVGNPSTVSARTVQSGGNPINASVAAGILALGDRHGGAIEGCMEMLQSGEKPRWIVKDRLKNGEKIPGIGHKIYTEEDPRATRILEKAERLGVAGQHVERMKSIREEFAKEKVELPMNVDGAIAAVASDLGWEPELGKGIFIIARTPGLVAHVREEMEEGDVRREEGEYEP